MDQPYHRFVKRWQAFKFELRPNGTQRRQMRCFAGSCRFVYNKGLAVQKARFEAGETKLTYAGLCKLLTQWRSETQTGWLKEAPAQPLQQALKDLERAYLNFFAERADFPGTGGEFARHILDEMKLGHVKVEETKLGDHYDPDDKAVRLLPQHFNGRSLSAVVIAARRHEEARAHAPGLRAGSLPRFRSFMTRERSSRLRFRTRR